MKPTQMQKVLEVLQQNYKKWLPAWYFVGKRAGINGQVFLSYKAPARLSDIFKTFPDHLERRVQVAEGSRYYSYKLIKKVYSKKSS